MALSKTRFVVGSTPNPEFSFGGITLLSDEIVDTSTQFTVARNGTLLVLDTDYTVDEGASIITLIGATASALSEGDIVVIQRDTEKEELYVTFVNNAGFTAEDINTAFTQIFFIAQEAYDYAEGAMQKVPDESTWDAEGLAIENGAPATTGTGFVTKNQVIDILGGAETATVDSVDVWNFTGDGTTDTFSIPGVAKFTDTPMYIVTIDGRVIHCPTTSEASWSSGTPGSTGGTPSDGQAELVQDEFPTGVCITAGPTAAATIVTTLNALKARLEAENLTTVIAYGTTSGYEFLGPLEDAIDYFDTGGGGSGGNGYYRYCPQDIRFLPLTYHVDSDAETIEFSYAPSAGVTIQVRGWVGTVRSEWAEDTINGDAVIDGTLTYSKFDFGAGSNYRFIMGDTAGTASITTLTAAMVTDFNTAVRTNRLDQMAYPTSNVIMNFQKITSLLSGTTTYEAVNYGQLSTINSTLTTSIANLTTYVQAAMRGGIDQNYYGTSPDLYFQTQAGVRGGTAPTLADATKWANVTCKEARLTSVARYTTPATTDDTLLQYFVPRRLTVMAYGRLYNVDAAGTPTTQYSGTDVNHVFRFERWDENVDVGFYPYVSVNNNVYRYLMTPAEYAKDGADRENGNSLPGSAVCYLELHGPSARTWLCFEDGSGNPLALCKAATPATRGVIQIIAEKGL